ncbi:MAG: alpha/beta fold family hydrolase [Pseudomonadota bacterium]|jgi:pimeloyl-ACP methyl ester carboxylesterase
MTKIEKKIGYFESFDGQQIYFESRGKGEPIVFVYGIACLINHWHHQIDYFSRSARTLVIDLRGHHKTAKPHSLDSLTIEHIGKDLKFLLQSLRINKAHFVGHSFGAQVLLSAYQSNPEMFKSLTLINGFASNPVSDMFGLGVVDKLYHFIRNSYRDNPVMWKTLWKLGVDSPLAVPFTSLAGGFNLKLTSLKDIQVYAKGVSNMDLDVFLKLFEELMNYDGSAILKTIECPTLVISGENDKVTPVKFQKEMAFNIPNSEFLVVPYGSHCTQLDFPDYINLKLEKFLMLENT